MVIIMKLWDLYTTTSNILLDLLLPNFNGNAGQRDTIPVNY